MEVTTAVGREMTGRQWGVGLLAGAGLVAVVTGVVALVAPHVPGHLGTPVLYLFAVLPVALRWGTGPGAVTAVASSVVFALVFVAPRFTFSFTEPEYAVALAVYLVTAVVVGHLAARSQREAREAARLSGEQAALRRVATLVAESAPPSAVFQAVTREVGLLCAADLARMERYEPDGSVTGVAGWSRVPVQLAVGRRLPLDGPSLAREVRQAGSPARMSSFAGADGVIASEARKLGIRSSVGCPIVGDGALGGVIAASTRNDGPFARDAETQIGKFTELVGTAIGNAANREELNRLAQEQAALRR